jgi:thiosulfate dehydrogenase [quinone] large subunit
MIVTDRPHQLAVAALRIVVGVIFLWAGLEKLVGAGPEGFSAAGFLQFGTGGSLGWPFVTGEVAEGTVFNPTQGLWSSIAGNSTLLGIVNVLVPWGQLGIGISLILGLLTRFGAGMGTLMMLFFFLAAWEFEFGIVNQHLTYAVVTAFLGYIRAGNYFGLDGVLAGGAPRGLRRWLMSGDPHRETVTGTAAV